MTPPEEKIEIVRRSFEAMSRDDVPALLAIYDPEIEFLPLTGTRVESGGYRGHSGVRDYFEEIAEIWEHMHPYCNEFEVFEDDVVVVGGCAVRGKSSGAETDTPLAWVITVRDGRITRHRGYRTAAEARQDAVRLESRTGGAPAPPRR
jgi:ketosteroid isomerase-like protein